MLCDRPNQKSSNQKFTGQFTELQISVRKLAWQEGKGNKGKVASRGFCNTPASRAYCILAPTSSRIHLQRRYASYR
jgi:hypothetical protein